MPKIKKANSRRVANTIASAKLYREYLSKTAESLLAVQLCSRPNALQVYDMLHNAVYGSPMSAPDIVEVLRIMKTVLQK